MSTDANKALVRRYYDEVLNRGDLAVVDELLAPEFVSHAPSGATFGLEQYRQTIAMSRGAFPDLHVVVEAQLAEADRVVTRWTARGTHTGAFMGLPPSGRQVSVSAIHIHRIAGRRVVEHWEQIDALGLLQQLGALPAPGQAQPSR